MMIEESGCQPDEKFYSALARGCLQAGALEKAVSVVRCAYHLPGSGLTASRGPPVGLETRVLDEVIAKLKAGGARDRETAAALLAELKTDSRGADVSDVTILQPLKRLLPSSFQRTIRFS